MCTGLEPLFLAMGAEGATAATLATVAGSAAMTGLAAKALQPKIPSPQIPTPEKPPQATKGPDRATLLASNASAAMPGGAFAGNNSTFLTGPSGIGTGSLSLGRNTLLGA